MGRVRKPTLGDDKENGTVPFSTRASLFGGTAASVRFSRPWDNANEGPPAKRATPDAPDPRFASLRVEHFVDANIASRAALFENPTDSDAPRTVTQIASRFEPPLPPGVRPGSIVRPWPDSPLRESAAHNPNFAAAAFAGPPNPAPPAAAPADPVAQANDHLAPAESPIKTLLGRRSVKPILIDANPPQFHGLPIPDKSPAKSPARAPRPPLSPGPVSPARGGTGPMSPARPGAAAMRTPTAEGAATPARRCSVRAPGVASPGGARASARCSVRAPALNSAERRASRRASRHSVRVAPSAANRLSKRVPSRGGADAPQIPRDLGALQVHAVLPFDEHRASVADAPVGAPTSIADAPPPPPPDAGEAAPRASLDFSDPDTFDTFGSLDLGPDEDPGGGGCGGGARGDEDDDAEHCSFAEFETPEKNVGALPGLVASVGSDAPIFPEMSSFGAPPTPPPPPAATPAAPAAKRAAAGDPDEDDGDVYDVPQDLIAGAGGKALRELQCASVTAGNELAAQVREMASRREEAAAAGARGAAAERISRAQGELELRSRFFRRWNTRYASIVDHAYFGAVLFLFRHDSKASRQGTIALKNSKMIVLADSTVRELDGFRRNGPPSLFELKTAQRKYVFACLDDEQRAYWLDNLTSFASG